MKFLFLFFTLLKWFEVFSQSPDYPQDYFHSPLNIPLYLAGNFGEPRQDAYHMGLDLGTNGVEGQLVSAAADGYVSRIKVSAFGYGNALYITHPNGYMTVYGHLSKYMDTIAHWIKAQQYMKESFEVDMYPDSNMFKVKQGELIGYSGNTGRSGGPHLHFEIRDAKGETAPINPLLFGIPVTDNVRPVIQSLELFSLDNGIYQNTPVVYALSGGYGKYNLSQSVISTTSTRVCFGLNVVDYMQSGGAAIGLYEMKTYLDSQLIFTYRMDRLEWENNRDANAQVDFKIKRYNNDDSYLSCQLPGNTNPIYYDLINNGVIMLNDTLKHSIKIEAIDFDGNISTLSFFLKKKIAIQAAPKNYFSFLPYNEEHDLAMDSIRLHFPKGVLYDDIYFQYSRAPRTAGIYSDIYTIHQYSVPLHSDFTITVLPYKIPDSLRTKTVMVYKNYKGTLNVKPTQWHDQYIVSQTKDFGQYFVMTDVAAPAISCSNFVSGQKLGAGKIVFIISDNLSGIGTYRGTVDGKWVLMIYDAKNNVLSFQADSSISAGTHTLLLTVNDVVNNTKIYTLKFVK